MVKATAASNAQTKLASEKVCEDEVAVVLVSKGVIGLDVARSISQVQAAKRDRSRQPYATSTRAAPDSSRAFSPMISPPKRS